MRGSLESRPLLEPLFGWLRSIGAGGWASVLVPLVVVAVAVPVFVVASLLRRGDADDAGDRPPGRGAPLPELEARHGGSFWSGVAISLGCTAVALRGAGAAAFRSGSCRRSCWSCRR